MSTGTSSTSSQIVSLAAEHRATGGKSATRRVRAAGALPGVAYGKNLTSSPVSVPPKDVLAVLKSAKGKNTLIKLTLSGSAAADAKPADAVRGNTQRKATNRAEGELLVMIKDYTFHPVSRSLTHVDFVEVKLGEPVDVDVPLVTHGKAVGVTAGGLLRQVFRTLPVRCTPDRVPVRIDVDVTSLALGAHIATKDLTLPEGVSVRYAPEQTLIAVVAPEKDKGEETAAAAAAPGAAAPAAAGAKPAAGAAAAAPAKDAKKK
jgi:large subunit ribosomal protein L25